MAIYKAFQPPLDGGIEGSSATDCVADLTDLMDGSSAADYVADVTDLMDGSSAADYVTDLTDGWKKDSR